MIQRCAPQQLPSVAPVHILTCPLFSILPSRLGHDTSGIPGLGGSAPMFAANNSNSGHCSLQGCSETMFIRPENTFWTADPTPVCASHPGCHWRISCTQQRSCPHGEEECRQRIAVRAACSALVKETFSLGYNIFIQPPSLPATLAATKVCTFACLLSICSAPDGLHWGQAFRHHKTPGDL